jgi:hypothetical protein
MQYVHFANKNSSPRRSLRGSATVPAIIACAAIALYVVGGVLGRSAGADPRKGGAPVSKPVGTVLAGGTPGVAAASKPTKATVIADRTLTRGDYTVVVTRAATLKTRPVKITFRPQTAAKTVTVAGTFNGWNAATHPMRRTGRTWTATVLLPSGTHEYKFVVNGEQWIADPSAPQITDREGNVNARVIVPVQDDSAFFLSQLQSAPGNYIRVGLQGAVNRYTAYTQSADGTQWKRTQILHGGQPRWSAWSRM